MLLASIAHFYVFPHEEWKEGYQAKRLSQLAADKGMKFGDNLAIRDFLHDIKIVMGGGTKKVDVAQEEDAGEFGSGMSPEDAARKLSLSSGVVEPNPFGGTSSSEIQAAEKRIRESLASMEEGEGGGLEDSPSVASIDSSVASSAANLLSVADETSSLLAPASGGGGGEQSGETKAGDAEQKKGGKVVEEAPATGSGKKTQHFRPKNSRIHR